MLTNSAACYGYTAAVQHTFNRCSVLSVLAGRLDFKMTVHDIVWFMITHHGASFAYMV
jgi:hypothetical protein